MPGLDVLLFDDHVIDQASLGSDNFKYRFTEERIIVLLKPLIIESAWKLNRELTLAIFFLQA